MSIKLRVEMIIFAIIFLFIVFRTINKNKLLMQYSIIWVVISIGMIIMSFNFNAVKRIAYFIGVKTPSNFIYLLALVALLCITFYLTIIVSKQSLKIKSLVQLVSVKNILDKEIKNDENPK